MIDSIDKVIIAELEKNARISFANLARKINLSPSAVRERVQKMEELGVIQKYVVQTNNKMLGYDLEAFILIKVFPGKLKHVIQSITEFPEITEAHRITGNQNIHLKVLIKDQIHLQKLLDRLMDFGDTNTFLILTRVGD
jgi:Lrp/AsnC family leucine-responsive transcriptional regulator